MSNEIFWSVKLIHNISTLVNRHLPTMIKQIKLGKLDDDSSLYITQEWLIIKNFTKERDDKDLKEMWIRLNKQLFESIEGDAIMEDFESQFLLEDDKSEDYWDMSQPFVAKHDRVKGI